MSNKRKTPGMFGSKWNLVWLLPFFLLQQTTQWVRRKFQRDEPATPEGEEGG